MVCDKNGRRPLRLEERCLILGISLSRAKFLADCAHDDKGKSRDGHSSDRGQSIPYDEAVLVREAFRLGISFKDTARMMEMNHDTLSTFGLSFRSKSIHPAPAGPGRIYNLFPPEKRKNKP